MPRSRMIGSALNFGGLGSAGGGVQSWEQYITSLAPLAWYRQMQTSGTNEPNLGSVGAAANMTITSTTLGQTGKLGANNAYLYDGAASRLQTANNATLAGLLAFEYVFLINPSSAGEGGFGAFAFWANNFNPAFFFNGALTSVGGRVGNSGANFSTTTTSGFAADTWGLLFVAYNDAGDRKLHFYKGVSGAVSEFGYGAQPALTGTYNVPTLQLNVGNNAGQSQTFAGLMDEAIIFSGNLTPAQRTQLTLLAGV